MLEHWHLGASLDLLSVHAELWQSYLLWASISSLKNKSGTQLSCAYGITYCSGGICKSEVHSNTLSDSVLARTQNILFQICYTPKPRPRYQN